MYNPKSSVATEFIDDDEIQQTLAYAAANKNTLKEMDINPVYVYEKGEGLCVIDALIVKE